MVAAACSGAEDSSVEETPNEPSLVENDAVNDTGTTATMQSAGDAVTNDGSASSVPTTAAIDTTPVVRVGENEGVDVGGFNIGHGEMNEDLVELNWTEPIAGTTGEPVIYRVYRITSLGNDPKTATLGPDVLVYDGPDLATVDTQVQANTFYTYVLEVEIEAGIIDRRAWTDALTTTDVNPPSKISALTAETNDGEVTLRWSPATDDVEFASYAVSLQTDDGLRYLGGGAGPEQTNFVDNAPLTGTSTYVVQAVDFHNNRSDPTSIEVTVE